MNIVELRPQELSPRLFKLIINNMNLQQFKQKLRDLKITQRKLAEDLGISFQQVTNWNKNGVYPFYVTIYFENINNKEELAALKAKVKDLLKITE